MDSDGTRDTFEQLGLSPDILAALAEAGWTTPPPSPQTAAPPALAGQDVIGCAQTGTGKTAAFVLPMIGRLAHGRPHRELRPAPTTGAGQRPHGGAVPAA